MQDKTGVNPKMISGRLSARRLSECLLFFLCLNRVRLEPSQSISGDLSWV